MASRLAGASSTIRILLIGLPRELRLLPVGSKAHSNEALWTHYQRGRSIRKGEYCSFLATTTDGKGVGPSLTWVGGRQVPQNQLDVPGGGALLAADDLLGGFSHS